jgi:hypothetical protein
VLWVLCLSAQALLIGAIIQRKLLRGYPFFVAYLTLDLGCSLALLQIPYHGPDYAKAFRTYQILTAVLQVGMAGEMFQRLCWHFREFRGFSRFRFFMGAALLALTGVFFLALFPDVPALYPHRVIIWLVRWETAVLAITLALSWWVLTRFLGLRPQMRSNALAHARILIVFFAINALSDGLNLIAERTTPIRATNVLMLIGDLACFIAWIVCLRRDGEQLAPELPVSPEALAYSRFWRRRILQHVQQARR